MVKKLNFFGPPKSIFGNPLKSILFCKNCDFFLTMCVFRLNTLFSNVLLQYWHNKISKNDDFSCRFAGPKMLSFFEFFYRFATSFFGKWCPGYMALGARNQFWGPKKKVLYLQEKPIFASFSFNLPKDMRRNVILGHFKVCSKCSFFVFFVIF